MHTVYCWKFEWLSAHSQHSVQIKSLWTFNYNPFSQLQPRERVLLPGLWSLMSLCGAVISTLSQSAPHPSSTLSSMLSTFTSSGSLVNTSPHISLALHQYLTDGFAIRGLAIYIGFILSLKSFNWCESYWFAIPKFFILDYTWKPFKTCCKLQEQQINGIFYEFFFPNFAFCINNVWGERIIVFCTVCNSCLPHNIGK